MTKADRKKLLIAGASLVGALLVFTIVWASVLRPAAILDANAAYLEEQIRATRAELAGEPQVRARLEDLFRHTFDPNETKVSEALRSRVTDLLRPSGLVTQQFRLLPVNSPPVPKTKDRPVSRTITIKEGRLGNVVDLLYLLDEEPHLHRFDTLKLTPASERGKVDLSVTYSTLVMDMPKGPLPATLPADVQTASLDSNDRHYLRIIEERDIFRPYEKKRTVPVEVVQSTGNPPPPEPGWRLAGLPTIFGTEMVHVRNMQNGETRTYKIGQTLPFLDGKIVMIDCRLMPRHDNPKLFSDSRVILQMKDTYWAVELGDPLAQKHRLTPPELPPELRTPASGPAGGISLTEDGRP